MKYIYIAIVVLITSGCAAYITPTGTYIEPLLAEIVIGPPVVVAPPPAYAVEPLPPVVVVPGRPLYFYRDSYYYYWDSSWYWSRHDRGPWHALPRERWPSRMERREHEREHGRGR